MDNLSLSIKCSHAVTYAAEQNDVPLVDEIGIENLSEWPFSDLQVRFSFDPEFAETVPLNIALAAPGEKCVIRQHKVDLQHRFLSQLSESVRGSIRIQVFQQDRLLTEMAEPIEVLSYDQWAGIRELPELIAAFSQPNSSAVAQILRRASEKLLAEKKESLSGYQAPDRQAVARQIAAIYSVIDEQAIHYSNPPASFISNGQKIRLPERILDEGLATCLDLALLFASCLEQAGLHPLILMAEGHAWVGCWLIEKTMHTPASFDRQELRKRIDAGELIAFETTMVTPQSKGSFANALKLGKEYLNDDAKNAFKMAVDIQRSRGHNIRPLPLRKGLDIASSPEPKENKPVSGIEDIELPLFVPETAIPTTTASEEPQAGRIDQWKSKLLDLSLRNRQLNLKQTKQTVPIYYPEPAHIEDLIAEGKALKFHSLVDLLGGSEVRSEDRQSRRTNIHTKDQIAIEAFSRNEILADLASIELDARLTTIFRAARTAQEEGGANTLYLVIGMLQWVQREDTTRSFLAPIIMVPVTLERKAMRAGFTLRRHDDETIVNPTLLQMLEQHYALRIDDISSPTDIPLDGSGVDVDKIWANFRKAVIDIPGFEVKPDLCLGMFSFTKYLMWKDLNDRSEQLLESDIVKVLANQNVSHDVLTGTFASEHELDRIKAPHELFIPDDSDSSQLAAINAAAEGMNFVLKGPPGTGKSQTITNIIADSLARGKTVLFVSEKIAALSVVHERLKKLGLEPFLLELHSSKASKIDVLAQFEHALKSSSKRGAGNGWQQEANRIAQLRSSLNEYVDCLHTVHKNGWTVYRAMSDLIAHRSWTVCEFPWPNADQHTREEFEDLEAIVQELGNTLELVESIDLALFENVRCREWSPVWQTDLLAHARKGISAIDAVMAAFSQLAAALGSAITIEDVNHYYSFSKLCLILEQVRPEYSTLLFDSNYTRSIAFLRDLATHGRKRNGIAASIGQVYREDVFVLDAAALIQEWDHASAEWLLPRWLKQRKFRQILVNYRKDGKAPQAEEMPALLAAINEVRKENEVLEKSSPAAINLLGSVWRGRQTDWDTVDSYVHWLFDYSYALTLFADDGKLSSEIQDAVKESICHEGASYAREGRIGRLLEKYLSAFDEFAQNDTETIRLCLKGTETLYAIEDDATPINEVRNQYAYWIEKANCLKDICLWNDVKKRAADKGLNAFAEILLGREIPASDIEVYFRYSYAAWWMNIIITQSPLLSKFASTNHERLIRNFREKDLEFTKLTREYIHSKLASRVPTGPSPATSPLGILRREMQKKMRHIPVRKLLSTLSDVLPDLKPCLMMSPLSIAQYLDTSRAKYDLVVFDEASQIPTWDAIGAIARGKQVIVVGDPKQLPPTSFFTKTSDEGDEETVEMVDLESILDECIASGLPTHTLKWHYRSQRESLIAFSNYRYYGSELITFPSPVTPENGVVYHHVPGVYDRSGSRTNKKEAEAIVGFIRSHFMDGENGKRSLGVVTFSQAQQTLIEDLLDQARQEDADLDQKILAQPEEPIFVKNLENVQGDERDVILFSVGYGPDEMGRVYMNFGPLNKTGGHRRLNVAVTRAKWQIHIFATLRPEQIDAAKTQAAGVNDLKLYLEYAIKGPQAIIAHAAPTGRTPETPFEQEVITFIRDNGWNVHPQVGCSSYRIDAAVVDPKDAGRYLLAVECDGASYHSAATARDRDKLRQMVLERLGWKVHRIWSTEWWMNPQREKVRLLDVLKNFKG